MNIETAIKHGQVNRAFNEMLEQLDEWLSYPDKEAQRKTARVYLDTILFIFTKLDPIVAEQYYASRIFLKAAYWQSRRKRGHDDEPPAAQVDPPL